MGGRAIESTLERAPIANLYDSPSIAKRQSPTAPDDPYQRRRSAASPQVESELRSPFSVANRSSCSRTRIFRSFLIERLWVKKHGQIAIRFSWWPNGRMATRPLDLPERELLELLREAVKEGVFSDAFVGNLLSILRDAPKPRTRGK